MAGSRYSCSWSAHANAIVTPHCRAARTQNVSEKLRRHAIERLGVIQETDEFHRRVRDVNSETAMPGLVEVGAKGNPGGPFTAFNAVLQDVANVHPTASAAANPQPINWIEVNQYIRAFKFARKEQVAHVHLKLLPPN